MLLLLLYSPGRVDLEAYVDSGHSVRLGSVNLTKLLAVHCSTERLNWTVNLFVAGHLWTEIS